MCKVLLQTAGVHVSSDLGSLVTLRHRDQASSIAYSYSSNILQVVTGSDLY
jgi:hypothetical protein